MAADPYIFKRHTSSRRRLPAMLLYKFSDMFRLLLIPPAAADRMVLLAQQSSTEEMVFRAMEHRTKDQWKHQFYLFSFIYLFIYFTFFLSGCIFCICIYSIETVPHCDAALTVTSAPDVIDW